MGKTPRLKVKTRAVIRRGEDVLLSFAIDPGSGQRYGRFLGGSIEFGERAEACVCRELHEEIGFEIRTTGRLGVIEDVADWDGRIHHEVTFVFEAVFVDPAAYARDAFVVNETVCDGPAVWVPLARIRSGEIPMYPPELLTLFR